MRKTSYFYGPTVLLSGHCLDVYHLQLQIDIDNSMKQKKDFCHRAWETSVKVIVFCLKQQAQ